MCDTDWKATVRTVFERQEPLAAFLIAVAEAATAPRESAAPYALGVANAHVAAALTCAVVHEARAIQRAGNPRGASMATPEQRRAADRAARDLADQPRLLWAMREHMGLLVEMPMHHAAVEQLVGDAMDAFEVAESAARGNLAA